MRTALAALLLGALLAVTHANVRVKRIVGGEKAAIPKPVEFAAGVKEALTAQKRSSSSSKTTTTAKPAKITTGDTVVAIYEEEVTTKIEGVLQQDGSVLFKGLRYAEIPTERRRFQRPIVHHPTGNIKADTFGSPCIQPTADGSSTVGSEDCLFMNIHTPSVYVKNATGAPVFFWIHGGGFTSGSGNQYGAADLVKKNIVVVTFNYRLGTLGFLGSRDQQMAGNSGLFDVRAAFSWVQRYIVYFGGSPRHITVAGQGCGASMAMLLSQSDFTNGYLKGVMAMSGTGISSNAMDYQPTNTSKFIANSTKCSKLGPLETLRCIQKTSITSLFSVDKSLQTDRIGDGGFVNAISKLLSAGPMVEGKNDGRFLPYFLHDVPLNALKSNTTSKVPLLIGTAQAETGKSITGKFKEDVLKRLKVPDFLAKALPKALVQNNVGVFVGNIANQLINLLFNNEVYLKLFSFISKATTETGKVIESTTDALFNLPSSTTAQLWKTAGGESYHYSFQHESTKAPTKHFLEGMHLFSGAPASTEKTGSSHGDDLLYLFELQTLEGKPVTESALKESKDLKVKSIFVEAVTEFVRTGKPKIAELKAAWPPFNPDHSYVIIAETPKIETKFRYCEVALWGGFTDILKNPFCNLPGINDIISKIPVNLAGASILNPTDLTTNVEDFAGSLKSKLNLPTVPVPVPLPTDLVDKSPLGGATSLLGGDKSSSSKNTAGLIPGTNILSKSTEKPKTKQSTTTTKKPSSGPLGLGNVFG